VRILLASDHYPPFIGGAHRQGQLLARGMVSRGHEVAVVTPWHGGFPAVENDGGVTVYRLRQFRTAIPALIRNRRQRHQPPFPDPVTVWSLRRVLAQMNPQLVHSHGWFTYSVVAALGGKRTPLLVTARDYGYFCATRTLVHKGAPCSGPAPLKCLACAGDYYGAPRGWIAAAGVAACRPLLLRKMGWLHSVSSYVGSAQRRHLIEPGGKDRSIVQMTLPDIQPADPAAPGSGDPELDQYLSQLPQEPFILFVGAFRRIKGLETLFAAYRRLSSPPPLVLMGTFEWDSPTDFPPEAIVISNVPNAAVMAAWDRAMLGVMPSLLPEPRAGTIVEAMSRGKPVIGTQLGGSVDMVDDSTGILVPQDDDRALAGAMEELIRDPERREALGRAAAERAQQWTASAVLPRYEQAYREIVAATEAG
jgi:glycosyltransferase involved in cell wall biosynthesis